jgi:CRP-like cAMP-binding protein
MSSDSFKKAIEGRTPLRHVSQCYLQAYLAQASQTLACHRLHTLEAQFARWLLVTHDRVKGADFLLTQEFMASMLGVRRPSVSKVAAACQRAGLIKYHRGRMTILNRARLEQTACECYASVLSQYKRVLNTPYG